MCRIEYADEDGRWLAAPAPRKARKRHTCGDCGRFISPGETYTTGTYLCDDYLDPIKMCEHCLAAGHWLNKVCGGHLWPGVVDELREHWHEEHDLRSVGLARLVISAKRHWLRRNGSLVPVEVVRSWAEAGVRRVPVEALH